MRHIDHMTVFYFVALVISVILHEISHGVVALWFGDDTAKRAGRLTLNPVPHIDPFGSIILPAMGAIAGVPFIAFAKPVPVNPNQLRNPRRDGLLVSLAGPATNLLLMLVAAVITRALFRGGYSPTIVDFAFAFAFVNLLLGLFNLVPIPPLDGSAILERMLPREWLPAWHRFRPYGLLVLFLLVFTVGFGRVFSPAIDALHNYIVQ